MGIYGDTTKLSKIIQNQAMFVLMVFGDSPIEEASIN